MQIFGIPSQVPILIVDSHTIKAERVVPDSQYPSKVIGSPATEKPVHFLTVTPSHGKVLRVVVFVHGFQVGVIIFQESKLDIGLYFLKKQLGIF